MTNMGCLDDFDHQLNHMTSYCKEYEFFYYRKCTERRRTKSPPPKTHTHAYNQKNYYYQSVTIAMSEGNQIT